MARQAEVGDLLEDDQYSASSQRETLPEPVTSRSSRGQIRGGRTGSDQQEQASIFKQSSHPLALACFLFFRTAALITYLLGVLFTSNFILLFVIIMLLLAFDFWTVKNVSGRLLCGLRWWNETGPDGESVWVFESADPQRPSNPTDTKIFWMVLYVIPLVWFGFAFIAILKFEFVWLTIVLVAMVLNLANVLAFTRCDKDAKRKWASGAAAGMLSGSAGSGIARRVGGMVLSVFR